MPIVLNVLGCASAPEHRPLTFSGFLKDYSGFRPSPDGTGAWAYLKPGRDLRPFDKVMIDPLVVWNSPGAEFEGINSAAMWQLPLTFHQQAVKALESGYTIVDRPGPGVLRIRAAITEVVASKPGLEAPGPILPLAGDVVLGMSSKMTGTNLFVGEAGLEAELLDSQTNERLIGYIEKRRSTSTHVSQRDTSVQPILEVFDYWARKLRQRLDEERGLRKYEKEIR